MTLPFKAVRHFLIAAVCLCAGAAAGAEPPSYALACKGLSGNQNLVVESNDANAPGRTTFIYTFKKSSDRASAGLTPGECAWMDRPLNSSEPNRIEFVQEGAFVRVGLGGPTHKPNVTLIAHEGANVTATNKLLYALRNEREVQVMAYTRGNLLVVTKIGR